MKEQNIYKNREKYSLLSEHRILNIAHRGASGHAPEHTLEAYRLAQEMCVDYLEIDLQMTKDEQLVAMHDPDISRTSFQQGHIHQFTLDEIKKLDVGTWFNHKYPEKAKKHFEHLTVPTLDEIIDEFGKDANYYIEIKHPDDQPKMIDKLLQTLKKHRLIENDPQKGQVIIQSFSKKSLQEIHKRDPSLPLIQLLSDPKDVLNSEKELKKIKQYAIGIGPNYKHLTKKHVKKARKFDLLIHPYTVNHPSDMARLIQWGVTGMFTDYPDRLNHVIKRMESLHNLRPISK